MKAMAIRPAARRAEVVEIEPPRLESETAVRFRTLEVGVCGTDEELCRFDYGAPPAGADYLIVGHEALGEVLEVGPGVTRFGAGDLVVPSVRRPCPRADCPACRSDNQDYCITGEYTERGILGAHGFLAKEVVEEERYLTPVPRELRAVAVLVEPLTIAEKALRQYLAVQRRLPWLAGADDAELLRGRRAAVLGAGPVGLLGALLLAERGCTVTMFSRRRPPNAESQLLAGAGIGYMSSEETSFDELARRLGPPELIYEATGASELALGVAQHLAPNGVAILTGVPGPHRRIELDGDAALRALVLGNGAVVGTVNASADDFAAAVRDLGRIQARWPAALAAIITDRYPLDAFCECATAREGIKHIIVLPEEAV